MTYKNFLDLEGTLENGIEDPFVKLMEKKIEDKKEETTRESVLLATIAELRGVLEYIDDEIHPSEIPMRELIEKTLEKTKDIK